MLNAKRVVRLILALIVAVSCLLFASSGPVGTNSSPQRPDQIRIVTVVKRTGIVWFERMEQGIKQFAAQTGVNATMTGAADADPQKQADIIRKLIEEKPAAITVVPNSPEALEGVLKQAREAGIKVVTHEASNQVNTDVDIEAFDNLAFGAHLMDELASCMGGKGKYVAFVGHVTARSHMRWVTAAHERARQKYPNTSLPSVAGEFLNDGAVDKIFLWDPVIAGQAQDKLALMLIKGQHVGPGLDLGLPGYSNLKRIPGTPHTLAGSGWIAIDKANVNDYHF